jgi:hypothetical protein
MSIVMMATAGPSWPAHNIRAKTIANVLHA